MPTSKGSYIGVFGSYSDRYRICSGYNYFEGINFRGNAFRKVFVDLIFVE